ncbi:Actin-related protein 2/3 complex subunit 4 [Bonamia ostreae]|uniref:Actin-related protein 2/3 complex subunit 4 n=1 Tax=Bonamia ostreae TaxID=126728 RepID=A0ABV2AM66_9EUKA
MANTLAPYLKKVRAALNEGMCLRNFPSQKIERHNKPEVEARMNKELLLDPIEVSRTAREKVLIEPSVNSVRISIALKKADELEEVLADRFMRFLMQRAEEFEVLRRKPVGEYDLSFLVTNFHTEEMIKHKVVDFIIEFMEMVDKEISGMKLSVNSRSRVVTQEFLRQF